MVVKMMKMVMVMMLNVQNIHIFPSRPSLKLSHPSLSPRRLTPVDCQPGSHVLWFLLDSANRKYINGKSVRGKRIWIFISPAPFAGSQFDSDCILKVTIPFS